jgi:hypothetical protein
LPSSMHVPTGGSQSLMAQNEPIIAHTAEGAPLTSMLRIRLAAETGMTPKPKATAQSAAQRTNVVIVMSFFMGYSFHLERAVGVRFLRWPAECRREAHVLQANSRSRSRLNIDPGHGQPVQEMNPARYRI